MYIERHVLHLFHFGNCQGKDMNRNHREHKIKIRVREDQSIVTVDI